MASGDQVCCSMGVLVNGNIIICAFDAIIINKILKYLYRCIVIHSRLLNFSYLRRKLSYSLVTVTPGSRAGTGFNTGDIRLSSTLEV